MPRFLQGIQMVARTRLLLRLGVPWLGIGTHFSQGIQMLARARLLLKLGVPWLGIQETSKIVKP